MNFVTATGSTYASKLYITFCNNTKKFSEMYVDLIWGWNKGWDSKQNL